MFSQIRRDIRCILERDPAARHAWEVVTCYPGLHALWLHRIAHLLWQWGFKWFARFVSYASRWMTGIEIHPAAKIGQGVFFDHAMGVVIGETAEVGDGCTIYQGVTLGGTSLGRGEKRHPTLEANVVVGAGAKILGGFTVEEGARIGSNAVVTKAVPRGATVVGNPARVIEKQSGEQHFSAYGVSQNDDPLTKAMHDLASHANEQSHQVTLLWQAIEALSQKQCCDIPQDAHRKDEALSIDDWKDV